MRGVWFFSSFQVSRRHPSLSGSLTVTFCSDNVVVNQSGASTKLLQCFNGNMKKQNVDFVVGDFDMSAFSAVGDVFSDADFSAPWLFIPVGIVSALGFSLFDRDTSSYIPEPYAAFCPIFVHPLLTKHPQPLLAFCPNFCPNIKFSGCFEHFFGQN